MQGGKNWILPKEINANRFFLGSHWLEIWKNRLCPSMGPSGGSVAVDSETEYNCSLGDLNLLTEFWQCWPDTNYANASHLTFLKQKMVRLY